MALSPEDSQKITNLQQRILANVSQGKPASEGITQEELKASLDLLRSQRAKALASGAEKKVGGKKAKAAKPALKPSGALEALLAKKGLNLD